MFDKFETQIMRHMILRVLMSVGGVRLRLWKAKTDNE